MPSHGLHKRPLDVSDIAEQTNLIYCESVTRHSRLDVKLPNTAVMLSELQWCFCEAYLHLFYTTRPLFHK